MCYYNIELSSSLTSYTKTPSSLIFQILCCINNEYFKQYSKEIQNAHQPKLKPSMLETYLTANHLFNIKITPFACEEDNLLPNFYICTQANIMYTIYLIAIHTPTFLWTPLSVSRTGNKDLKLRKQVIMKMSSRANNLL